MASTPSSSRRRPGTPGRLLSSYGAGSGTTPNGSSAQPPRRPPPERLRQPILCTLLPRHGPRPCLDKRRWRGRRPPCTQPLIRRAVRVRRRLEARRRPKRRRIARPACGAGRRGRLSALWPRARRRQSWTRNRCCAAAAAAAAALFLVQAIRLGRKRLRGSESCSRRDSSGPREDGEPGTLAARAGNQGWTGGAVRARVHARSPAPSAAGARPRPA